MISLDVAIAASLERLPISEIVPTAQGYEIATYVPIHLQGEAQGSELVLFDDRLDVLNRQALPVCRGDDDSWLEDFFEGIGEFFDDLFEGLDGFDHLPIPSQIVTMYGKLDPTPAVTDMDDEGRVGIVTAGPCHVVAFAKTGSTLTEAWRHELTRNSMPLSSPALMLDGALAISGGKADWGHGHVYDLDPLTGDRLWRSRLAARPSPIQTAPGPPAGSCSATSSRRLPRATGSSTSTAWRTSSALRPET